MDVHSPIDVFIGIDLYDLNQWPITWNSPAEIKMSQAEMESSQAPMNILAATKSEIINWTRYLFHQQKWGFCP